MDCGAWVELMWVEWVLWEEIAMLDVVPDSDPAPAARPVGSWGFVKCCGGFAEAVGFADVPWAAV